MGVFVGVTILVGVGSTEVAAIRSPPLLRYNPLLTCQSQENRAARRQTFQVSENLEGLDHGEDTKNPPEW
ncbi:MAG: hypothetical protein KKD28_01360 [Chloroflexi bacterium]|nr:hypothetical protein [Chloroflexota bacterium]MBU1660101.1 hypothetical protein [Chloroflexota bacterium]